METKSKIINLRKFKMKGDNFDRGFVLKRGLTIREARFVLKNILGIAICGREDVYYADEYSHYNEELVKNVNDWLRGETDDERIMNEYAGDCGDESIGIWNAFKIAKYLIKNNII